jgi:hypothetical protein
MRQPRELHWRRFLSRWLRQPFLLTENRGHWGTAARIAGLAQLNKRDFAQAVSVSGPAAGSCTAGGFYFDGASHEQVFAATELAGKWGSAIEIPGTGALNQGADADRYSVACASAGNCSADGFYKDSGGHIQAFVANETAKVRRR